MARFRLVPVVRLLVVSLVAVLLIGPDPTPSFAATSLRVPFAPNETWYVYNGYNDGPCHYSLTRCGGSAHDEYYSFDLVYDNGTCNPRLSGHRNIYAPVSGTITHKSVLINGEGIFLKIRADDGYVTHLYHVTDVPSSVSLNARVSTGRFIGRVYTGHSSGIDHLHIQVTNSSGASQPLTIAGKHFYKRGDISDQWRFTSFRNNIASPPGDATRDGKVDILDYTRLWENFGKKNACGNIADFNLDGNINMGDYTLMYDYFGDRG